MKKHSEAFKQAKRANRTFTRHALKTLPLPLKIVFIAIALACFCFLAFCYSFISTAYDSITQDLESRQTDPPHKNRQGHTQRPARPSYDRPYPKPRND